MSLNQGVIGKFKFGGETAHTGDHSPVLLSGPKKTDSGFFPAGLLLAREASGELAPYDGNGALAGVCDEPCEADSAECVYQAHGTVKARLLTKHGGAALDAADVAALHALTIYPL